MGEDENRHALEGLFGGGAMALSAEDEYALRAHDYVLEMPQSGERIVGRDRMRSMQQAHPAPPSIKLRRIVGVGDLFVLEGVSEYPGGGTFNVVNVVEFADGKIVRETRYYAEPFAAPEWRSPWVDRGEPFL